MVSMKKRGILVKSIEWDPFTFGKGYQVPQLTTIYRCQEP